MSTVTFILVVTLVVVLDIIGYIGSFVPAIPGTPLCLLSLGITYLCFPQNVSLTLLITMAVLCLLTIIMDYFAPTIVTKLGGGSKYAIVGSTLGSFIGLFFPPLGIIWVPFIGALTGELIANYRKVGKAFKVAFLSFLSFILTTGLKLVVCTVISFYSIKACF